MVSNLDNDPAPETDQLDVTTNRIVKRNGRIFNGFIALRRKNESYKRCYSFIFNGPLRRGLVEMTNYRGST